MTVLLVGPETDPELDAVRSALEERGVDSAVLDTGDFPGGGSISCRQGETTTVQWDGVTLDPATVQSVFIRGLGLDPRMDDGSDAIERRPVSYLNQLREYRALVQSVLHSLQERDVPMINGIQSGLLQAAKPYQHHRFERAGVPIPASLATSDPDALESFVDDCERVVYKPVAGGGHAAELAEADLDRLERLANSPVLFQEHIEGANLRLYVLDGRVIASVRIESDTLDYRAGEHTVERVDIDEQHAQAAVDAAAAMELRFAGVDIIAGEDGFVVLEANSSPMFAAVDDRAGTDIAGALADALCEQ